MSVVTSKNWMFTVHKEVEAVWIPEFCPKQHQENQIIQIILNLFYVHNICCAIVGNFPLFLAGILSEFDEVFLCVANTKECLSTLNSFIEDNNTTFWIHGLHFRFLPSQNNKFYYSVSYNSLSVFFFFSALKIIL